MSGRLDSKCEDQVIEAEKRSLSLFSTERMEDYIALIAAGVVLLLVFIFVE